MCGTRFNNAVYDDAAAASQSQPAYMLSPSRIISDIISKEAGVYIDPKVIRLIVKYNWRELSKAAHEIHKDA